MPLVLEDDVAPAGDAEEGQIAYEALSDLINDSPAETVAGLVTALQSRTPWERLPLLLRQTCAEFEGMLFEDDGQAEA